MILTELRGPLKKMYIITKTSPYNEDPFTPHFCIVKLGFTGVYIIFLFLLRVPTIYVLSKGKKIITIFQRKFVIFTVVKYNCILYGRDTVI